MRTGLVARLLLGLLGCTVPSLALERARGPQDLRFSGGPEAAARSYLGSASAPAEARGVDLERKTVLPGSKATTVRFMQRYQGLPVLRAGAAVRVGTDGRVHLAVTDLAPGLAVSIKPTVAPEAARALVASKAGVSLDKVKTPRLAVLPGGEDAPEGRLVWEMNAASRLGGERFLVDAHRGTLVSRQALAREVLGRVFKISSKETPKATDEPLLDLDPAEPQRLNAYNGRLSMYQYVSGGPQQPFVGSQDIGPNVGIDFLYDPPSKTDKTDEFAVVNSYYHIHRIHEFFEKSLGVDMSPASWSLGVIANARESGAPMDNAFYSQAGMDEPSHPNLIAIGQGSEDFAWDSDVFMHEFTHYVSQNAIGYNQGQFGIDQFGVSAFGGSIDEGISDYFACTVNNSPSMGEAVLQGSGRDLSIDDGRRCPEGLFGEVHEDGKIIGNIAWKIRELVGPELADQMIWSGSSLLPFATSLQDFADNVTAVAEEMVTDGKLSAEQLAQIKVYFDERGLYDCGRILSLNTEARSVNQLGLDLMGQFFGVGCFQLKNFLSLSSPFHFSYKPDEDAKKIRFDVVVNEVFGGGTLDWRLLVRRGKPVAFGPSQNGFPEPFDFDFDFGASSDSGGSFEIGEGTPHKLVPGSTYYAVLVHRNCPYTQLTVLASSDNGTGGAGQGGSGGASGAAGAGVGGAGAGGAVGGAGAAGKAGAGVSGSSGQAGLGGLGGLGGQGGTPPVGANIEGVVTPEGGEGCGCRAAGAPASPGAASGVALGLAALLCRRRARAAR